MRLPKVQPVFLEFDMTEDLIAMARKAGAWPELSTTPKKDVEFLQRFAALIEARAVARTREECAKVCEAGMDNSMEERMKSKSIQLNGADGELEALKFWSTVSLYNNARALCAAAIRALGERA